MSSSAATAAPPPPPPEAAVPPNMSPETHEIYQYDGWTLGRLRRQRHRAHFLLEDPYRFVTVLLVERPTDPTKTTTTRTTKTTAADGGEAPPGVAEPSMTITKKREKQHNNSNNNKLVTGGTDAGRGAPPPPPPASYTQELYCLDSPCYHANGAMGEGDIVEIEDYTLFSDKNQNNSNNNNAHHINDNGDGGLGGGGGGESHAARRTPLLCIRCPTHRYLVSLGLGEEIFIDDMRSDFFSEAPQTHTAGESNNNNTNGNDDDELFVPTPIFKLRGTVSHSRSGSSGSNSGSGCTIRRGAPVQKFHAVHLDEATGILSIGIEKVEARRRRGGPAAARPLRSEGPALSLQTGGMCMQVAHIREQGLDNV